MTPKKTKPAKNPKHRTMSFKKAQRLRNERVAKFLVDMSRPPLDETELALALLRKSVATCDLCGDDTHDVGFVDDAQTFKVCKFCDTDGSQFNPKEWPQEVLDEINIDRDTGEFKRGEEE